MTRSDAACLTPQIPAYQHGKGICAMGQALYPLASQAPPCGHGRPRNPCLSDPSGRGGTGGGQASDHNYSWFNAHCQRILEFARTHRLPTVCWVRAYAEAGCLIAYAPDIIEMFRRAAVFVDKILKGAKPSALPVAQPAKFELVVNLKTAQALGRMLPASFLFQANEVTRKPGCAARLDPGFWPGSRPTILSRKSSWTAGSRCSPCEIGADDRQWGTSYQIPKMHGPNRCTVRALA